MTEYINRERARFEAKRYFKNMDEIQEDLDMLFCMLPAENVAPVRHGRWVKRGRRWQCTNCKVLMSIDGTPKENLLNYCPNCGADMRGSNDE